VYNEKVDTCPVENHNYRELEEKIFKKMVEGMMSRLGINNRFTMLSYEEAVRKATSESSSWNEIVGGL